MQASDHTNTTQRPFMRWVKYFFGWLGVLVDLGCLGITAYIVWAMYQPNGGDAILLLVFGGPILLGIMLVSTLVATACFMSLRRARLAPRENVRLDEHHLTIGVEGQPHFAGFWVRFAALLVDILILIIPCYLLRVALAGPIILPWLYSVLLINSARQGTLGMMAFGLRIVDAEGHGLSLSRATCRYVGSVVSALPLGIGYLVPLADKRKRTLHDRLAGTLVVYGS